MQFKRLALATGCGLAMGLVVWLFTGEASPARAGLMHAHGASYGVLLLNLPALYVSRLLSGSPPAESFVYAACFLQWFGIGFALSLLIWRRADSAGADGA